MRLRCRSRDDRGDSTLLLVACVVALILAVGLVVDGSARLRADDQAQFAADQAARAAGQQVAISDYRAGRGPRVQTARAISVAQASLAASDVTGTVDVTGAAIVVDTQVTVPTVFLSLIGIGEVTGSGHAEARLTRGITQEAP